MRGWVRVLLWGVILLACAGVGAFIGSRSNPFPPGVPDPGAQPSDGPSPSPPELDEWPITMVSRTTHTFRVGGSCTSAWRVKGTLRIFVTDRITGRGVARLQRGAGCDFPSAQVQAEQVLVEFLGRREGDELDLRFQEVGRKPAGSQDLGAFVKALETLRVAIVEQPGSEVRKQTRIEDPEDEIYRSATTIRLGA
ncbi:MAG TPA: hypothetical protein VFI35_01500 [Actinomycetota bacterium]|nr:hypothetical protein [Actinomycetota bacterium]